MKAKFALLCLLAVLMLAGCGEQPQAPAPETTAPAVTETAATEVPTMEATEPETDTDTQALGYMVTAFADAYFSGNLNTLGSYLATGYSGDREVYPDDGSTVQIARIDGLDNVAQSLAEKGCCYLSIPFRETAAGDYYMYLSITAVKEGGGWKVSFYGLEM